MYNELDFHIWIGWLFFFLVYLLKILTTVINMGFQVVLILYTHCQIVLQNAPHKSDNDKMHCCVADINNVWQIQSHFTMFTPSVGTVSAALQGVHVQVSTNETHALIFIVLRIQILLFEGRIKCNYVSYDMLLFSHWYFLTILNFISLFFFQFLNHLFIPLLARLK